MDSTNFRNFHFIFTKRDILPLNPSSESRELTNYNRMSSIVPLPTDYVNEAATCISIR